MKYLLAAGALALSTAVYAQQPAGPAAPKPETDERATAGPRYTAAGELMRPTDFREWMFVTSGLGMTYNQPTLKAGRPRARPASPMST